MTEAGWTRKKPTVAGWYWWRGKEESGIALVFPADKPMPWHTSDHSARVQLFYSAGGMSSTRVNDFGGEWLGPISPDSYQQGRVEGLREYREVVARELQLDHSNHPTRFKASIIEALDKADFEVSKQAAQDEKGVGDGNTKG